MVDTAATLSPGGVVGTGERSRISVLSVDHRQSGALAGRTRRARYNYRGLGGGGAGGRVSLVGAAAPGRRFIETGRRSRLHNLRLF